MGAAIGLREDFGSVRMRALARTVSSTPGTETGTSKPKFGSVRNSAPFCESFSDPFSAADSSARVARIGIREPTP